MPFQFNRYGKGLLGFLDAKVRGQQPTAIHEVLQGTVDMSRFLEAGGEERINVFPLVTVAPGFFAVAGMTCPQGELWLLLGFAFSTTAGMSTAGDIFDCFPAINRVALNTFVAEAIGPQTVQVFPDAPCAFSLRVPNLLHPGDQLGLFRTQIVHAAGSISGAFQARIVRLPI